MDYKKARNHCQDVDNCVDEDHCVPPWDRLGIESTVRMDADQ